ncbi:MAG: ABC transporter substrate-binding protein, partial [Myxococcota bacterium]
GLAWGADYPDAENFLQLFYGPNKSPGTNKFNYNNPAYDALYDQIRSMEPGPERTAIYKQMRDILIEDVPAIGSMGRTRFYLWNPRLKNVMPAEVWYRWLKYLDVEPSAE